MSQAAWSPGADLKKVLSIAVGQGGHPSEEIPSTLVYVEMAVHQAKSL
jgi:hypothetical protein